MFTFKKMLMCGVLSGVCILGAGAFSTPAYGAVKARGHVVAGPVRVEAGRTRVGPFRTVHTASYAGPRAAYHRRTVVR